MHGTALSVLEYLDGTNDPLEDPYNAAYGWLDESQFGNRSEVEKMFLRHFLDESGTPQTSDVVDFLNDVVNARSHYESEMTAAMQLVSQLEFIGTINLTEINASLEQSGGIWAFGIGQYTSWSDISVTGSLNADGSIHYSFIYTYNFWDPYDWNPNKGGGAWWDPFNSIANGDRVAQILARLHLMGHAQQFMMTGEASSDTVEWSNNENPPPPTLPSGG